jgi:hypothetical protein
MQSRAQASASAVRGAAPSMFPAPSTRCAARRRLRSFSSGEPGASPDGSASRAGAGAPRRTSSTVSLSTTRFEPPTLTA